MSQSDSFDAFQANLYTQTTANPFPENRDLWQDPTPSPALTHPDQSNWPTSSSQMPAQLPTQLPGYVANTYVTPNEVEIDPADILMDDTYIPPQTTSDFTPMNSETYLDTANQATTTHQPRRSLRNASIASSSSTRSTPRSPPSHSSSSSSATTTQSSIPPARIAHNLVERKYRDTLNIELERLRKAVPAMANLAEGSVRPSKATVLASAVAYIQQLEAERDRYLSELNGQ